MVNVVNPWRRRACPKCGEGFYPGQCAIVSTIDRDVIRGPRKSFFSRLFVQSVLGKKLTKRQATRQCPNLKCGYLLPYNVEYADSYTIAIVGDGSSGKSHYIASVIHQLRQLPAMQVIGCTSITGQGDTDFKYTSSYFNYFKARTRIPVTQRGVISEPLIYTLNFRSKSPLQPGRVVNLLFYDSSGEDQNDPTQLVQFSDYILNASAIIFLADPMAMKSVRDEMPSHLQPDANLVRADDPSYVMNRILQTFGRGQGFRGGTPLKTPIAIALSKSDLLKFVYRGNQLPLFMYETSYASKLNPQEFAKIDEEVRHFLQSKGDPVLVYRSQEFASASFFAVSATGWPLDPGGKYPTIEPLRCLDPLLWALARLEIITSN